MDMRRLRLALCAGLLLPLAAFAANHDVTITGNSFAPSDITVAVGDTVTFRNQSGGLHNAVTDPGAPNVFRCANGCDGSGGNGSPSASNWTAVVTLNNPGVTRYYCFVHGGPGGEGMSGSITVTGTAATPPTTRDDLVRLRMGEGPFDIAVLANDVIDAAALAGGSLAIVAPPGAGTATVFDGATPGNAADDQIRYTLPAGVAVDTTLTYRACTASAGCDDGVLRILARGLHDDDLAIDAPADAGFEDLTLAGLPALPGARYETTVLVAPTINSPIIGADLTPASAWDSAGGTNTLIAVVPVPGDGLPEDYAAVVEVTATGGGNVDLFLGPDLDNDGQADESELRCTSAMVANGVERCEIALTHPGSGQVRYWTRVQNRGAGTTTATVERALVPLAPDATQLVATGPGNLPAGTTAPLRLGWDDSRWVIDPVRYGYVMVRPQPGSDLGRTPVRLRRVGGPAVARVLASGVDQRLVLDSAQAHERLYIDVPPGATSLTVTTTATQTVDLYLARHATLTHPAIQAAPARGAAVASSTGAANNTLITLTPPDLVPGRWYVTPQSVATFPAEVVVRATVAGNAPVVRSGSYFNPDRSGHGMFVYPAGGSLAILWYHYFEDGSPTWYYLEGLQPGANGAWRSDVYRSAWDGDSNVLSRVGTATMVPSGADAFTWSWIVDGQAGSEPLVSLGRGCPTVATVARDSSSTWFDPATAGTGYSIQLFPNATGAGYEYNAAFVYDGIGRPRYLAAELGSAGPAVATYDLEQLTGFCPLCARTGPPSRQTIGTFTRTYGGDGQLQRIEVDGLFTGGIPGAWSGDDQVQLLGGPGTAQGCEL